MLETRGNIVQRNILVQTRGDLTVNAVLEVGAVTEAARGITVADWFEVRLVQDGRGLEGVTLRVTEEETGVEAT